MGNSRSRRRSQGRRGRSEPISTRSSARRWGRYAIWIGGLAGLVGLIVVVVVGTGNDSGAPPDAPEGTEVFAVGEPSHVTGSVAYPQDPPVGGPHSPEEIPCGYYDTPVVNELAVHTLEHGVVWITYSPDLAESDLALLAARGGERKVMVSPYPGLDAPVIASAWGRQLRLDSATDQRLDQFIGAFRDGPQSPEPFASC